METITILLDFKGVGQVNIMIIPDGCPPYKQTEPGSKEVILSQGNYELRAEGVISIKGASIVILKGDEQLAKLNLPTGYFSRPLNFTV